MFGQIFLTLNNTFQKITSIFHSYQIDNKNDQNDIIEHPLEYRLRENDLTGILNYFNVNYIFIISILFYVFIACQMYQTHLKKKIIQKVRIWFNEHSERRILRGEKIQMAQELQVSLEKLEQLIKNEIRRNKQIKKKNLYSKHNMIRKLKNFSTFITLYPEATDIYNLSIELNMDRKKISSWFQRERAKIERDKKVEKIFELKN